MSLFLFFIFLSIGVSFLCSMLEAVILSVTPSYLASLKNLKPKLYAKVSNLKDDIEKPLASILTFNTIAHTVGAAGAGAEAQRLFGSDVLAIFSAILTFVILFFSEIIPKSLGASNWKTFLPMSATILKPMVLIAYPLVWLSEKISRLFKSDPDTISRDEIVAMADIGLSHGAIEQAEHKALKGLIQFEEVKAKDIITPKEKVRSLLSHLSLENAYQDILDHTYSRIVVFNQKGGVEGYVLRSQLLHAHIINSNDDVQSITSPLITLKESISLPSLFQKLLRRREHICSIESDAGEFLGIISLEDLIENMLDIEIYDEQDHLNPS